MASRWMDLVGTVKNSFKIGLNKATVDASGLTAARTFTLPDSSGTLALSGGAGGLTLTTVEKNLGSVERRCGSFQITGLAGLTTGKPVLMTQAKGPYTNKGTREDEAAMDRIDVTAFVLNATTIQCYWFSDRKVRGNFKFDYSISG